MFDTLPPDILEHVAYYASTPTVLGPPSGLIPLLSLYRAINATLRRSANPHLYARIFEAKFDLAAPRRRLARLCKSRSSSFLSVNSLADELVRRFTVLRRIRIELDARSPDEEYDEEKAADKEYKYSEEDARLDEVLWTAFLMVLEDEGRNAAQLHNARIEAWLAVFWFDPQGMSGALRTLSFDRWPVVPSYSLRRKQKTRHALAMWLLWFFLDPAAYVANSDLYHRAERVLKLVALNAPFYHVSHLPWTSFKPGSSQVNLDSLDISEAVYLRAIFSHCKQQLAIDLPFKYFSLQLPKLTPLPPAIAAILALLALHACNRHNADTLEGGADLLEILGPSLEEPFIALPRANLGDPRREHEADRRILGTVRHGSCEKTQEAVVHTNSYRWESEWLQCLYSVEENIWLPSASGAENSGTEPTISNNGDDPYNEDGEKYRTFEPGSLEGTWEGTFTYAEFHSFASLLSGNSPSKLQDCLIAQQGQTWRIREYHLLSPPRCAPDDSSSFSFLDRSESQTNNKEENQVPLPIGDPILANIPGDTAIEDDHSSLRMSLLSDYRNIPTPFDSHPSSGPLPRMYTYTRFSGSGSDQKKSSEGAEEEWKRDEYASRVQDIIVRGEGHSGWGEFRLIGRVRPADGFINISKEYVGTERGRWLYRGYLVGGGSSPYGRGILNSEAGAQYFESSQPGEDRDGRGETKGYLVGRWRDTVTPAETHGYEGAFGMARRR